MSSQSPSIILGQRVSAAGEESTTTDLQQVASKVLSILRYRRWLFILPVLTGTLATLAIALAVPRQYNMRAVFERRDDPVMIRLVSNSPYNFESLRKSLRFSLVGTEAVGRAYDRIESEQKQASAASAVPAGDPDREAHIARLTGSMSAALLDTSPNYDLVELRYSGDEPDLGEKLVNTLKDDYIRRSQAMVLAVQQRTQKFFATEVENRRTRLARMQAEMTQVLVEQPELAPSRPDWLNERLVAENLAIEQLTRQKTEIMSETQAREEYLRQLDEQEKQGKFPQAVFTTKPVEDSQRQRLEGKIAEITAEISDAKTVRHMKDTHPHVEGLNRKLAQLRSELEAAPQVYEATAEGNAVNPVNPWEQERRRIGMEIKTWRGKLNQLERDLARHQADRHQLEADKSTVCDRQREYMLRQQELETLKSDLTVWQTKLEEINRSMTAESMDRGTRFSTVEECHRPGKPTTPKLSGTFMLSGGMGLALGIVAVFLREIFDRSFRNPARVRQILGIPVLETIGEINVRRSSRRGLLLCAGRGLVVAEAILIVGLAFLNYASLESPARYAQWTGAWTARLSSLVGMFNAHWG